MPLEKQALAVRLSKLDTSGDPKTTVPGTLELVENAMAVRHSDQGVEFVKRYGLVHLTKAVDPFTVASVTAGRKLAPFGSELVMTDGKVLYSWGGTAYGGWVPKGRCPSLSAVRSQLDGVPAFGANVFNEKTSQDSAYAGGWAVFLANFTDGGTPGISYFIVDTNDGSTVFRGTVSAYRGRVLAVGSTFFLFTYDGTNGLSCYTMAVGTLGFGNRQTVVAAASMGSHFFDVTYDSSANARFIVGYRNTTPGLTLKIWTTGNTGGSSANYNTRNPDKAIGFLHQAWTSGNVYLGIASTADGVRALTFDATTLAFVDDTQATATATIRNVTGWREASATVLVYEVPGASADLNRVDAWRSPATITNVKRGCGLVSRVFKVVTTYHFSVALESATQKHQYLIEMQPGGSLSGAVTIEGLLLADDAGGLNPDAAFLGGPAALSSERMQLGCMAQLGAGVGTSGVRHYTVERLDLRFNEDLLSSPVAMNGTLHIPGACSMVYDGANVFEEGFLAYPEAVTITGGSGAGAAVTAGTYQYLIVFARTDRSGRISRSIAGPIASVTLGGSFAGIVLATVPTLRMVTSDAFRTAPTERIEIYRTRVDGSTFYLTTSLTNDPTTDAIATVTDTTSDANLVLNEVLYTTTGQAPNAMPPAVLQLCRHRDRLFASSGDGALYFTKEAPGILENAQFAAISDGFFVDFEPTEGAITALVSDGTSLYVSVRNRLYPLQGDGPDLAGNNGYTFPLPLEAALGLAVPRGFIPAPDGTVLRTPQGNFLLAGVNITPLPGADDYDSLTVTGGVSLDDRSMAVLTTSDGRSLVWDWVFKQWYTWTNHAAVASCLWQNKLVLLASDGTVKVDTAGTYSDNGSNINMKLRTGRLSLADLFGRLRLYSVRVLGEALATLTMGLTAAIEIYGATVTESFTMSVGTSTVFPVSTPNLAQERCEGVKITVEETSATAGLKVSALGLEVGIKPGAAKLSTGQVMT